MEDLIRNNILSYLILFGVIQGIILGFILLTKKGKNKTANRLLGAIILCFVFSNLDFWAGYTRYTLKFPHLVDISWPISFGFGPLMLLYFKANLRGRLNKHDIIYLIPFFFFFVYSFAFYFQESAYKYNIFINSRGINLPLKDFTRHFPSNPLGLRTTGNKLLIFYMLVFVGLTFTELIRAIKEYHIKISWSNKQIMWLISFLSALIIDMVIFIFLQTTYPSADNEYVFAILFTLIIYFVTYQVLVRSDFFNATLQNKKYEKSSLTEEMKDEILRKITNLYENEKPYLNNLFSLKSLAKSISANPNYVSQVINERTGLNIYEFTARYRVQEAMKILKQDNASKRTIDDIAFSVGYNSKSAFNKAFKKITGKTPSEYRM